jgi:hypothetical protein
MRTAVSLVTLAFFAPIATGCISNEYVIPREELYRLTTIPPDARGQQVHVIQDLGSRRSYAIPTDAPNWPQTEPWPQPAPPQEEERDTDVDIGLNPNIDIYVGPDGRYAADGYGRPNTGAGIPRSAGGARSANWRGTPPSGGGISGGGGAWRGSPPSGGGGGGGAWKGVPVPSGGGSSGGGSSGGGNWGSGGGGGGDAMVVLAVVLAAIAVVMAVALVSSEGVRFDGLAQMSPWQPVHLKQEGGGELVIALGDLSPVAIAGSVEAKVMDDEGYGIRTLDHLRLDRSWAPAFKLDGGSMTFARGGDVRSGFIANMQFGLFVRPWLGLMLTAGVGGAGDEFGATITRHNFGFELQSLPLALGPLQVGGFVNVGTAALASTASGSGPAEWGNEIGGGILGELQVTSRLALTVRAGANEAFFANSATSSPAATFTAGIALY